MPSNDHTLYLLSGPTAVGKTALALDWAQAHNAEILSCDALLFYKGMDIGTAKPSAEEQAQVPHHGIDLLPPDLGWNVSDYVAYAQRTVREIHERGKRVLVTGGSGFYLKAFVAPVADTIEISEAVRTEVRELESHAGLAGLLERLDILNPDGTGTLDRHNPRRVVRALERCIQSGKTVNELKAQFEAQPCAFATYTRKLCVLDRDNEDIDARIARRTQQMLDSGLVDEVKRLKEAGFEKNPTGSSAIGYAQTLQWLETGDTHEALADSIIQATCRLVRKQRSWFRNQVTPDAVLRLDDPTIKDHPVAALDTAFE